MAGLFDTFTVAKRGLSVQQSNINTTSHNIANAQTPGFSRQRSVVETTRPFGGMSRFDSCIAGQVGTGAEVTQIMRIRDSFLDYQVRTENSNYGTANIKNQYSYQVEDILNESQGSGVQTALSKFLKSFQELSLAPEKESNRTVAIQQAAALANTINSKYNQMENKKSDAQKELKQYTTETNKILDQINELNKQISGVCAVGMTPNDLMDSRDYLIDQLSSKFGVKIDKQPRETLDLSVTEDSSVGNLVNSDPNNANYARFSYVESAEFVKTGTDGSGNPIYDYTKLEVKYSVLGNKDNQETITVSGTADEISKLKKDLIEDRMIVGNQKGLIADASGVKITSMTASDLDKKIFNNITKGEIAGNQQVQDDMQGYMDQLDKFAASLAYSVNAIQTGDRGIAGDQGILDKNGAKVTTELFFTVRNVDGTLSITDSGITAKNIAINSALEKDPSQLNCGQYHVDDYSGEKDGTRALAIADLKNLKIDIGNLSISDGDFKSRADFFNSTTGSGLKFDAKNLNLTTDKQGTTLSEYYGTIISNLAIKNEAASNEVANGAIIKQALENQRTQVSGVSLDEEMTDLIQFQHAYQANAKMISTIDQLLDVVINGLKA